MNKLEELFSLKGKTLLVTGGARGIGKCVAEAAAGAGANIVLVDVLEEVAQKSAREIAEKYGVKAVACRCDVTDPVQVDGLFEWCSKEVGDIQLLFNNAGICQHKDALTLAYTDWQRVIDVNLNGIFLVARAFARALVAKGLPGAIVNTASMSASIVNIPQEQASYNASKAGVRHLTKSLAVEWAKYGIRVNCISPGYIATDLISEVRRDWVEQWVASIPAGRMGKPEELCGAVICLLSDSSSYTSGCDMVIDGCFTCV